MTVRGVFLTQAGSTRRPPSTLPGTAIFPIAISDAIQPLAIDELGTTTAWVHVYRPDRPGSGFVQPWGLGATADRLPVVRAAAEYGLLRKATVSADHH